jgi:hypothetical protein
MIGAARDALLAVRGAGSPGPGGGRHPSPGNDLTHLIRAARSSPVPRSQQDQKRALHALLAGGGSCPSRAAPPCRATPGLVAARWPAARPGGPGRRQAGPRASPATPGHGRSKRGALLAHAARPAPLARLVRPAGPRRGPKAGRGRRASWVGAQRQAGPRDSWPQATLGTAARGLAEPLPASHRLPAGALTQARGGGGGGPAGPRAPAPPGRHARGALPPAAVGGRRALGARAAARGRRPRSPPCATPSCRPAVSPSAAGRRSPPARRRGKGAPRRLRSALIRAPDCEPARPSLRRARAPSAGYAPMAPRCRRP